MREGIARIVGVQPDMTVVAEASDGEEAVEQFLRYRPDVTLMDLEMPTMNGVQAIQAIRQPSARRAHRRAHDVSRRRGHLSRDRGRGHGLPAEGHVARRPDPRHPRRPRRPARDSARDRRRARAASQPADADLPRIPGARAAGDREDETRRSPRRSGISGDTASAHIKSIFQKFNVHDRTAALAEALRRGIIHIP